MTLVEFFKLLNERSSSLSHKSIKGPWQMDEGTIVRVRLDTLINFARSDPKTHHLQYRDRREHWKVVVEILKAHGVFKEFEGNAELRAMMKEFLGR